MNAFRNKTYLTDKRSNKQTKQDNSAKTSTQWRNEDAILNHTNYD